MGMPPFLPGGHKPVLHPSSQPAKGCSRPPGNGGERLSSLAPSLDTLASKVAAGQMAVQDPGTHTPLSRRKREHSEGQSEERRGDEAGKPRMLGSVLERQEASDRIGGGSDETEGATGTGWPQQIHAGKPPRRPLWAHRRVEMGSGLRSGTENWEAAKGWPVGRPVASHTHPPSPPFPIQAKP